MLIEIRLLLLLLYNHRKAHKHKHRSSVTLNNALDYRANGLLLDYIGWTNELSDYRANGLGLGLWVRYSLLVR